ncbi:unnamed protein product [Dicrocoelium dendriticum]|nr:unnamed protein product [Dicrocoelium dendriticum]
MSGRVLKSVALLLSLSDSEEAMGLCDSSSLRRSRSYSNLVIDVPLTHCHSSSWLSNQSATSFTRTLMTSKMRLLSQLAMFFLNENDAKHTVHDDTRISTYPDATKHLLSLCQRLRIPCKFIDRPPRQQWLGENDRKSEASDTHQHNTILVIGEPALSTSGSDTPSFQNNIVVQALGFNMLSARQRASLAAFRQLAELKSHFK